MKLIYTIILCLIFNAICFAQPRVNNFSPSNGPIGSTVTISGSNFGSTAVNNIVYFGATRATVLTASPSMLTVQVPAGASYQPITVTSDGLTGYSKQPFTVTFTGGGNGFTANSFGRVASQETGNTPYDIITCDIDGDGKPDIITANNTANTISIHRNTSSPGAVSYAARLDINAGSGPYGIAAGDIDGDGRPEIAVTNYNDDNITVFRNTSSAGNISFATPFNFIAGNGPQHVAIYDLDKDGKPDVAIANAFGNTISLLRNTGSTGNIVFAAKVDFALGLFPCRMAIGDLDGDGNADIAVACKLSNGVRVLRNTGSIGVFNFSAGFTEPTGTQPTGICIGDIDGDDVPDLAVSNSLSNNFTRLTTFSVLKNTSTSGNISFAKTDFTTRTNVDNIAMSDLDGDGKPDVAITLFTLNTALFRNSSTAGNIAFSPGVDCANTGPFHIALCDMDGNGRTDIAEASLTTFDVNTLRNRITELPPAITSFTPVAAAAGDTVTITGSAFAGTTEVNFGSTPASSFTIVSPTVIKAVVALGSTGDVTVVTAAGIATLAGFTFMPSPVINSFTPAIAGTGQTITINGAFFEYATGVSFGGVPASTFTVLTPSTITAVVGAGATGDVTVTSVHGNAIARGFTYFPLPVVAGFTPTSGVEGTTVSITGSNFTEASAVTIGGKPVASFTVQSATSILAVAGAGVSGSVAVTTPGGTGSQGLFEFPPVTVDSFFPPRGNAGTIVTITGNNFSATPASNVVYFGAAPALVTAASTTSLTVLVPAGTTNQPITVTANGTTAYFNQPFQLTFAGADTALALTPASFKWVSRHLSGEDPSLIRSIDLDGDGKVDHVVASYSTDGSVFILSNNSTPGNILFGRIDTLLGPFYNANWQVEIADFNSDGKPDIVAAKLGGGEGSVIWVYTNTSTPGAISFAPKVNMPLLYGSIMAIAVSDFDGDSKPDIGAYDTKVVGGTGLLHAICIFRNTTINGTASFVRADAGIEGIDYNGKMHIGDFDNDKKTDFIFRGANLGSLKILPNVSTAGNIQFGTLTTLSFPETDIMSVADLDNDGKPDLITTVATYPFTYTPVFSVIKNNSASPGVFSFGPKINYNNGFAVTTVKPGELNGDGMPDLVVSYDGSTQKVAVHRNTSLNGNLSFDTSTIIFGTLAGCCVTYIADAVISDIDGDGKNDITSVDGNYVSVYRNQVKEPLKIPLCPPAGNTVIPSGLSGVSYQWKVNTGSSWVNLTDDQHYNGANSALLQLTNIPSSWYGYQYQCESGNLISNIFSLQFANTWTGAAGTTWENPANWSCGTLPDINTDVIITSGTISLNTNTSIRSLSISNGAYMVILTDIILTITH